MFEGRKYPSFFEVWTHVYERDRFISHLYSFRDYKDAIKTYLELEVGDDCPEVQLKYAEHPGCYRQRIFLLRDKSVAYDLDGKMIKIERRNLWNTTSAN